MVSRNLQNNTTLRTSLLRASRWGVLCAAFGAILMFVPGMTCPRTCSSNANCDDGDFCNGAETCDTSNAAADSIGCVAGTAPCTGATPVCVEVGDMCVECDGDDDCDDDAFCNGTETCSDAGACVDGTAPCAGETPVCLENSDECVECDGDDDCDDDLFCNGTETCGDGTCTAGTGPCADDETCVEEDDDCVTLCDDAGDCNDANACTTDACVNGGCANTPLDCDDDVACTTDSCAAGVCSNVDNCTGGQVCNAETGECEEAPMCTTDEDCDDGLFCNGAETCDVDTGDCIAGERPCDDDDGAGCPENGGTGTQTCSEGDAAAVCTPCIGECFEFTLGSDSLNGTTGDDCFDAVREFNPGNGMQIATLQTGDSANGLAGTDTLNATVGATGGTTATPTLAGIETLNFSVFDGPFTINANNVTGVDTIVTVNSVDDLTVNSLQELTNFGVTNVNSATVDLTLSFGLASATGGSADAITGTLSNVNMGTVTLTTPATTTNGFESMTLASGGGANTIATVTQTNGTTLATLNVTGDQPLTLNTLPNTILTYAASMHTGGLTLGTGTTAAAYVTFATANLTDMDTGSGADTIIFAGTLNTNDFSSATVDLGAGTDVVQATFAADFGVAQPFRNVEEFRFNATTAATVNMTSITGLTTLTNDADGSATAITLQNIPATSGAFPQLNYRGNNTQAAQTYDTVTYAGTGATGSSDVLNINVANRGTALNTGSSTTNAHTIGAITAAGYETVNVDVADGPATFGGITASTLVNFDVDASSNVTLGTVAPTAATLLQMDASGVTGNTSVTFDWVASGGTVTMGGGNDTVTIGTNSTATTLSVTLGAGNDTFTGDTDTDSADTINAGAGADVIQAGDGNDTITTGDGSDTVVYDQFTASDREDISDFTAGSGGDVMRFDISDLQLAGGDEFVGVVGSVAVNSSEEIVILTGVGYATDELAEDAIAGRVTTDGLDMVIIYFNTTDNSTHVTQDPDAGVDGAATIKLIGRLTNITTQAGHDALTIANIDSQA